MQKIYVFQHNLHLDWEFVGLSLKPGKCPILSNRTSLFLTHSFARYRRWTLWIISWRWFSRLLNRVSIIYYLFCDIQVKMEEFESILFWSILRNFTSVRYSSLTIQYSKSRACLKMFRVHFLTLMKVQYKEIKKKDLSTPHILALQCFINSGRGTIKYFFYFAPSSISFSFWLKIWNQGYTFVI